MTVKIVSVDVQSLCRQIALLDDLVTHAPHLTHQEAEEIGGLQTMLDELDRAFDPAFGQFEAARLEPAWTTPEEEEETQ